MPRKRLLGRLRPSLLVKSTMKVQMRIARALALGPATMSRGMTTMRTAQVAVLLLGPETMIVAPLLAPALEEMRQGTTTTMWTALLLVAGAAGARGGRKDFPFFLKG